MSAFTRKSPKEIHSQVATDMVAKQGGAGPVLPRSTNDVFARVLSAVAHELYGAIQATSDQILPDLANKDHLRRHSTIHGIDLKSATHANGSITFGGASGTKIESGTLLQRGDGAEFLTTSAGTIVAGTATVTIEAIEAGEGGNTEAAVQISLVEPIAGIVGDATVDAGGISGGVDEEEPDNLLARLLEHLREPPHGGAKHDYTAWVKAALGLTATRVWVYPLHLGLGTVGVTFTCDDRDDIVPTDDDVTTVQEYIDEHLAASGEQTGRPVTAEVIVFKPNDTSQAMTIKISPNTPQVQAAIQAELEDLFKREAEPGHYDSSGEEVELRRHISRAISLANSLGQASLEADLTTALGNAPVVPAATLLQGKILISHIREAVSIAADEVDHEITTPAANLVPAEGDIFTLGVITFEDLS